MLVSWLLMRWHHISSGMCFYEVASLNICDPACDLCTDAGDRPGNAVRHGVPGPVPSVGRSAGRKTQGGCERHCFHGESFTPLEFSDCAESVRRSVSQDPQPSSTGSRTRIPTRCFNAPRNILAQGKVYAHICCNHIRNRSMFFAYFLSSSCNDPPHIDNSSVVSGSWYQRACNPVDQQ